MSEAAHPVARVIALTPEHEEAFADLFARSHSTCFCQFWHFEGNKNAWLTRAVESPEESRREHAASLRDGDAGAGGLLALDAGVAIGWMKLTPRARVPKLRRLPVYRALDLGSDEGVFSIGCFLVRPDRRRQGIARLLLRAAEDHVRQAGGKLLEAYPRKCAGPLHDEEAWMGPEALFLEAGFTPVAGGSEWAEPYPVLRKAVNLATITR